MFEIDSDSKEKIPKLDKCEKIFEIIGFLLILFSWVAFISEYSKMDDQIYIIYSLDSEKKS